MAVLIKNTTQLTHFSCFFFMIFIVFGYFSKISLSEDQVENFIGSDPCPNFLQGYKQGTIPTKAQ